MLWCYLGWITENNYHSFKSLTEFCFTQGNSMNPRRTITSITILFMDFTVTENVDTFLFDLWKIGEIRQTGYHETCLYIKVFSVGRNTDVQTLILPGHKSEIVKQKREDPHCSGSNALQALKWWRNYKNIVQQSMKYYKTSNQLNTLAVI